MYYSYAPSGPMAMPCPHWEEDTPQNQARLQKLQNFVQFSSQMPMLCEDDVLHYYEQFLALSEAMTLARYLTDDERDTAFWCGFHPVDRIRLLPYSPDIPPHFEDVFTKARKVFSYIPEPTYMPISIPASPLPISPPPLNVAIPYPSPERPPEIRRPASAPPIAQCFNDLGEGDLCPQVDLGDLPRTCHGSDAHETSRLSPPPSPISFSPSPSLAHLPSSPHSPSPSLLLLEPSPFPQSPVRPSSPPCDLSHTPSPSPPLTILATTSPESSPLSAPDVLPVVLSPLDPVPTRPQPLPPDSSPMLSPSPSPVHATTSSPPSPPSFQLASRLQLLDGSCMSPRDGPLPLAFPPSPPPRPPDPMPVRSVEPQLPPPAPSLSSAFPSQPFDRTPMPRQKRSLRFPPPPTLHASPIPPLLPPLRPPDPAPVTSAKPQPPPPPVSSSTEATNVVATHHEAHRSKQPTDAFEPQNRSHPQCRRYRQRLQQRDFQYRYPLTSPQARRPRHLPRHPHDSRLTSIPHIAVGVSWTNELDISKAEKQADRGRSDFRPPSRCKAHDLSELVDYVLHY
jgi:hypothetical protein